MLTFPFYWIDRISVYPSIKLCGQRRALSDSQTCGRGHDKKEFWSHAPLLQFLGATSIILSRNQPLPCQTWWIFSPELLVRLIGSYRTQFFKWFITLLPQSIKVVKIRNFQIMTSVTVHRKVEKVVNQDV